MGVDGVDVQEDTYSAIFAGFDFTCGLDSITGDVRCWGANDDQELDHSLGSVSALGLGDGVGCAIINGTIACWGDGSLSQFAVPTQQVQKISIGRAHGCAINSGGINIDCWGSSSHNVNSDFSGVYTDVVSGEKLGSCA